MKITMKTWAYFVMGCMAIGFLVAAGSRGLVAFMPNALGVVVIYSVVAIAGFSAYKFLKGCGKL